MFEHVKLNRNLYSILMSKSYCVLMDDYQNNYPEVVDKSSGGLSQLYVREYLYSNLHNFFPSADADVKGQKDR